MPLTEQVPSRETLLFPLPKSPSRYKLWGLSGDLMLVIMDTHATEEQVRAVSAKLASLGLQCHVSRGSERTVVAVTGDTTGANPAALQLPGVKEVVRLGRGYKLASREWKSEDTVVPIPTTGTAIGGSEIVVMAGPCAVESLEQAFAIAERVAAQGATVFRGGAYKPRSSPYAFQGLGLEGLKILAEVRKRFGLAIVTEAIDIDVLPTVEEYADIIQIGSRNMQNFSLLKHAGKSRKPILLKRGMSATLDELLMAAEYILSEGNQQVILCERGVRTFTDHTRNTLDLSIIPAVKRLSHLPIIADPSHGTGQRESILPMARAALAAGADGIMVEVHDHPERARSDGQQSLYLDQFDEMMEQLRHIAPVVHRTVAGCADSPHASSSLPARSATAQ